MECICIMTNNQRKGIMKKFYYILFISIIFVSCDLFETNNDNVSSDKVYIALQGSDQVAIVNVNSNKIDFVDIDYTTMNHHGHMMSMGPHFIVMDEINRYWFVTTISSGYVGIYNLDTDELIDTIMVGDLPALMALNEDDKKLYVSRMMPMGDDNHGTVNTTIQEISYEDSSQMVLSNQFELKSPSPHGLSINSDGSELYVASNTADWLYKIYPETGDTLSASMDPLVNYIDPSIEVKRLKPIQCISVKDSLLVISCSGRFNTNSWTGEQDTIPGQVQLWNTNRMSFKDVVQFSWKATPWHIINSSINDEIFVVLSGDPLYPGSAGVACLTYGPNSLSIKWETYSENFEGLHGIDESADGKSLFVSGRGDGHLHILNADNGNKIKSIPLGDNLSSIKPNGVSAVYK